MLNKFLLPKKFDINEQLLIIYYFNGSLNLFVKGNELTFISLLISCSTIEFFIRKAKNGEEIYMRPIAAMTAMEEAVGRATEMGSSVLYVPGISGLDEIDTISGVPSFVKSPIASFLRSSAVL